MHTCRSLVQTFPGIGAAAIYTLKDFCYRLREFLKFLGIII
jgi:hypothetical protein